MVVSWSTKTNIFREYVIYVGSVPEFGGKKTPSNSMECNYDKNTTKHVPSEPGQGGDETMTECPNNKFPLLHLHSALPGTLSGGKITVRMMTNSPKLHQYVL